jgi:tetratricopeptide (TPR) repeat protein
MLLSETYECGPGDVFEMQDLIVHNIVGTLEPQLLHYERERVVKRPPPNPNAYELTQIGVWHHLKYTQDSSLNAREALTKALAVEPRNVQALTTLSISMTHAANVGWVSDPDETRMAALHFAEQVVEIAPRDPNAHFALGLAYQNLSRPADAAERYQRAIQLNPSHASAHANLGFVYCFLNRPDEGLPEIELAMRLSPSDPRRFLWIPSIAVSHYLAGRHRAALAAANEALRINPSYPVALRYTAAILGVLGRVQEARPIVEMVRRIDGGLEATARHLRRSYAEPAASIVLDGLRRAGLD